MWTFAAVRVRISSEFACFALISQASKLGDGAQDHGTVAMAASAQKDFQHQNYRRKKFRKRTRLAGGVRHGRAAYVYKVSCSAQSLADLFSFRTSLG
jgi:hypothetical protein